MMKEEYKGILNEWLENPSWREYFEKAPSEKCREVIALEFVYSELEEEGILDKKLVSTVRELYRNREKYIEAMAGAGQQESIPTIMGLLNDLADK